MIAPTCLHLSGERFTVTYRLTGDETTARAKAEDICIEQTVEFPADLVPDDDIRGQIFGRIESFDALEWNCYQTTISYAVETSGFDLTQLLNVAFGNISIKPGIRVVRFDLPQSLTQSFKGPRYGCTGWRRLLGEPTRPLLATAIKPMGFPVTGLADFAYQCALGGIDIIKDDHGLTNQSFTPFAERVERCVEAVARANQETGYHCIYMPNVTSPAEQLIENAQLAKKLGAGALLVVPGLVGLDAMRRLADDESINLPIMSHPSFSGTYVINPDTGFSHYVFYGQLTRLAGADAVVYPNYGGRFSFSREACQAIVAGATDKLGNLAPIYPAPGGGMSVDRLADMQEVYGREVIYLIGGALHRGEKVLAENARHFRQLVEQI